MNEFESDWISLSQSFVQNGWMQDGRFKMATIIKLSQNEWEKFFCAKWLNARWQNSRWPPSSSWIRMNEWSLFVQNGWMQDVRIQDACHHQVNQIEWVKYFVQMVKREEEVFFLEMVWTNLGKCGTLWEEKLRWLNSRWPNWRWLPSSSWVRMNKWSFFV